MKKIKTDGTCIKDAFYILVEIYKLGQEAELKTGLFYSDKIGFAYPHSWVEFNGMVFDFSNGSKYIKPAFMYYEKYKIKKVKSYSLLDIIKQIEEKGEFNFDKCYKKDFEIALKKAKEFNNNIMNNIKKWNFKTKKYEDYNPKFKNDIILFSDNMEQIVVCAGCGKKLKYGEAYTSLAIHNSIGLGYPVCASCYQKEFEEEKKFRN